MKRIISIDTKSTNKLQPPSANEMQQDILKAKTGSHVFFEYSSEPCSPLITNQHSIQEAQSYKTIGNVVPLQSYTSISIKQTKKEIESQFSQDMIKNKPKQPNQSFQRERSANKSVKGIKKQQSHEFFNYNNQKIQKERFLSRKNTFNSKKNQKGHQQLNLERSKKDVNNSSNCLQKIISTKAQLKENMKLQAENFLNYFQKPFIKQKGPPPQLDKLTYPSFQ